MSDTFSFIGPERLGTGEADETKVLYGDQTWRVPAAGGITTLTVTERAGSSTSAPSSASTTATATCSAGEISIGGGASITGTLGNVSISGSRRNSTNAWDITVRNESAGSRTFTPYVICLATS
jgi:hypothetical protein